MSDDNTREPNPNVAPRPENRGAESQSPTTDARRSLAGFGSEGQPLYGVSPRRQETIDTWQGDLENRDEFNSFSVSGDKLKDQEWAASDSGSAEIGGTEVAFGWIWAGFKLEILKPIQPIFDLVLSVLDFLLALLEAVKTILEVILAFIVGLDALLKAVVQKILDTIKDLLGFLDGKTGIYSLTIPPQFPPSENTGARLQLLNDMGISISKDLITKHTGNILTEFDEDKSLSADDPYKRFNLVPSGVTVAPVGGMRGFIDTVSASLSDTQDTRRPQFGPTAYVGGLMLIYGFTDLTRVLDFLKKMKKLFADFGKDVALSSPPSPSGVSAKVIGLTPALEGGKVPDILVQWKKVEPEYDRSVFANIASYRANSSRWIIANHRVYKTEELKGDLALPVELQLREFAAGDGEKYWPKAKIYEFPETRTFHRFESQLGTSVFYFDEISKTEKNKDYLGKTILYKVAHVYERYEPNNEALRTAGLLDSDGYVLEKTGGPRVTFEAVSPAVRIVIPEKAVGTGGPPPNWTKWASMADLLPDMKKAVEKLMFYIKTIAGLIGDLSGILQQLIKNIIAEVDFWLKLGTKISNLIELFRDLLNPSVGGYSLIFYGLGGNDFMLKILEDSYAEGLKIEEEKQAAGEASFAIGAEQRDNNVDSVLNKLGLAEGAKKFQHLKGADAFFNTNPVPTFGKNDAVGGWIVYAGDESVTAVLSIIEVIKLLFAQDDSDDAPEDANTAAGETVPEIVHLPLTMFPIEFSEDLATAEDSRTNPPESIPGRTAQGSHTSSAGAAATASDTPSTAYGSDAGSAEAISGGTSGVAGFAEDMTPITAEQIQEDPERYGNRC